jgi:hypothetical protein
MGSGVIAALAPSSMEDLTEQFTHLLNTLLWTTFFAFLKFFLLPAFLILILLLLAKSIFRRIIEGDLEVSFEWVKSLAVVFQGIKLASEIVGCADH